MRLCFYGTEPHRLAEIENYRRFLGQETFAWWIRLTAGLFSRDDAVCNMAMPSAGEGDFMAIKQSTWVFAR